MKKSVSVLTVEDWKKLSMATLSAFPKIWWRIFAINLLALLMIVLGTAIAGGVTILLVGGFSAFESIFANLMVSQYMAPSNWLILAFVLFFWINWIIVFGVTAKIASFLVVKDYTKKKTSNPAALYFQSSWSFFWRYIGLGFRNFWYIFWPFLVLIIVILIIAISFGDTVSHAQEEVAPVPMLISEEAPVDMEVEAEPVVEAVNTKDMEVLDLETQVDEDLNVYSEKDFDNRSEYRDYGDEPPSGSYLASIMRMLLGILFLFAIFGFIIWRSVHVVFSQMRLIEKDSTIREAFESSLAMVKGNWWKVFGSLFVFFGLVVFIPTLIFMLSSFGLDYLDAPLWIVDIVSNLYSYIVAAPLGVAFIYFLGLHIGKKKKI